MAGLAGFNTAEFDLGRKEIPGNADRTERWSEADKQDERSLSFELISEKRSSSAGKNEALRGKDKVEKPAEKKPGEKESGEAGKSALEILKDAMAALKENKFQLDAKHMKAFEKAIKKADQAPSPRIPELQKKLAENAKELEAAMPEEKQKRVQDLMGDTQKKLSETELSEEEKMALTLMLTMRDEEESPEGKAAIDKSLEELVPGVAKNLSEIEALMQPMLDKAAQTEGIMKELELENQQSTFTRLTYARVLHHLGQDAEARKQVRAAAARDQNLLKDRSFAELAQDLGLDMKSLRSFQI